MELDLRPVDTSAIINTRNRIRLFSSIAFYALILYITINTYLVGVHASWMHLIHFVVQPIVLVASIADGANITSVVTLLLISTMVVDTTVALLNVVTIYRCLGEVSTTCFERVYEKTIWLIVAFIFMLADFVTLTQINLLHKQLVLKDVHENAEKERILSMQIPPTWNSIILFNRKIKTTVTFTILFDIIFLFIIVAKQSPVYWIATGHIFIDVTILFMDMQSDNITFLHAIKITFVIIAMFDAISVLLQIQIGTKTIVETLAVLITMLYIIVDIMQLYFISNVILAVGKRNKFKQKI
jgi:hypothetical protein